METIALRLTKFFYSKQLRLLFSFNESNHEFSIRYDVGSLKEISFDKNLARVFGFKTLRFTELQHSDSIVSDIEQDLEAVGAFYIYTDIITHQFIGDANVKVIRVVALDNEYGMKAQYINKIYDMPHYVPLERNNIETINITIKDSTGENVPFESGKIVLKLHFRKRYF